MKILFQKETKIKRCHLYQQTTYQSFHHLHQSEKVHHQGFIIIIIIIIIIMIIIIKHKHYHDHNHRQFCCTVVQCTIPQARGTSSTLAYSSVRGKYISVWNKYVLVWIKYFCVWGKYFLVWGKYLSVWG